MLQLLPIFLLILSEFVIGSNVAIVCLFLAQLAILVSVVKERNLTGVGAFLFMSFLFFAMRPLYIWIEEDHRLFEGLFRFYPHTFLLNNAMWWATLGMLIFQLGGQAAVKMHSLNWRTRSARSKALTRRLPIVGLPLTIVILCFQLLTLGVMLGIASAGTTLYGSALGAYVYDFPVVMQGGHIFALLLTLERYLKSKSPSAFFCLFLASVFFVIFTFEMRSISFFRGFYLTGLMAGGIAVLARLKQHVSALWLVLPVVLLLPLFRVLGENRYAKSSELSEVVPQEVEVERSALQKYWDFYDGDGDMNIFDTFVAADLSRPKTSPYILSWLYVPVHLVPRAIWPSKPKNGTLQDMDFTYGAPYSPGIAGFFLLDGGRLWMLLCMGVLGYLISLVDCYVLTMPRTYLRFCLYGIVVVNAMGLSRYFLWQYFYGVLYAVIPCMILAKFVSSNMIRKRSQGVGLRSRPSGRHVQRETGNRFPKPLNPTQHSLPTSER